MNQNDDKSEGILILMVILMLVFLGTIYYFREDIAGIQKFIFYIDFTILNIITPLQGLLHQDVMLYEELLYNGDFNEVGYDVINNEYYNTLGGIEYRTFHDLYSILQNFNNILFSTLLFPYSILIWKYYNKIIEKYKINLKKEEVYPGIVKNKRRPSKNNIFELMDYFPPIISGVEDEFISGSLRLSKKNLDSNWMEIQKEKLLEKKKELGQFEYLKLIYLDKFYIRNVNDKEMLDYLRILRFKGMKPQRNTKKNAPKLPKQLTKENKSKVIKILKKNLLMHDKDVEYGRLMMPSYYIFTPLENKKLDEFECKGIGEFVQVIKKYVVDDFKKEVNKTIKEMKKEINKLSKNNDSESIEIVKQNTNLIEEMENMLDPDFNDSRNNKILNYATIHQYEETFLMSMLIYGRSLVNLPIGVLSKMKYENSVLWYALTSIGRTYKYKAGVPLSILHQIEIEEADAREKQTLDVETLSPDSILSDDVKNEINDTIGDQYKDKKAFDTNKAKSRTKIRKRIKKS